MPFSRELLEIRADTRLSICVIYDPIEGVGIFFSCSPSSSLLSLRPGYDLMRALICIMKPRSTGTSWTWYHPRKPLLVFFSSGGAYSEAHALFYSVVHPSVPCPVRFTPFSLVTLVVHIVAHHRRTIRIINSKKENFKKTYHLMSLVIRARVQEISSMTVLFRIVSLLSRIPNRSSVSRDASSLLPASLLPHSVVPSLSPSALPPFPPSSASPSALRPRQYSQ